MNGDQVWRVRSFNRAVTLSVGALQASYLARGRPLGEARLIFEVGAEGTDVRVLRMRLGLDSGYMSRMLQSLSSQGLVESRKDSRDGRLRRIVLTRKGREELDAYDTLSDRLAVSTLEPLDPRQRERLVGAMGEVERLLGAARAKVDFEPPTSEAARHCLESYIRELDERFEGGYDAAEDASSAGAEITPPGGRFVVARLDGDPIGCSALKRVDERAGEIKRVWVAKSARGLGIAPRMVRKLEAAAREMGLTILRLDTNSALTEALALHRKEGYREIERFNDNPYAHLWFEKRL